MAFSCFGFLLKITTTNYDGLIVREIYSALLLSSMRVISLRNERTVKDLCVIFLIFGLKERKIYLRLQFDIICFKKLFLFSIKEIH